MYRAYKIEEGDTISSIAYKFQSNEEELRKINNNSSIVPGQMMVVPASNSLFETYIVKKGDSMYAIGNMYDVNYKDLLLLNGLKETDYIYPNQEILVPKKNVAFYVTKENDSIKDISSYLGSNGMQTISQNENLIVLPDQLVVYKKR